MQIDTQEERLNFLVKELRRDSRNYGDISIPDDREEKRRLMRSFMNIRSPGPMGEEFLHVQDLFLQREAEEKGITEVFQIPSIKEEFGCDWEAAARMSLWQGDITTLAADAIVNAANSQLLGCFVPCHGCIDNAIHSAAGMQLREECDRLMKAQGHGEPTGSAKLTKAYNLPCKYVLHTVGPIIRGKLTAKDEQLLASCYRSCLRLAEEKSLRTIAFCCISTGEFHFPPDRAAKLAVSEARAFLAENTGLERVVFNVFKDEDFDLYKDLFNQSEGDGRFSL